MTNVTHAVAGNQILVAWTSKYCGQGSPRYSVKADTDLDGNGELDDPLYEDLFDVAGRQRSIDYAEWKHHGEYPYAHIGEVPFSCVWTARGTVEKVTNPQTDVNQWGIKWRKPERLTSGKRDAYYLGIDGAEGAGFAVTWQEDPKGLRPGYGEGPGTGWSGATVNHKTDIWYSHIGWHDFTAVDTSDQQIETNKPKVAERMAMPIRLTDNFNCLADRVDSDGNPSPGFCFEDFDDSGTADLCADVYPWTNSKGEVKNICVTEDGRLLNGQIGASRARMALEGYTRGDGTKSAWVLVSYEETKGLGFGHTDQEPLDIGKDVMYHSFDMFEPELAAPGHMLNLPETDPSSDPDNPTRLALIENDKEELQYQTAIARRPSLIVQPGSKVQAGKTSSVVLYKEGLLRQGGPSDIFMRRFVAPLDFDPTVDNPYDVANLICTAADEGIVQNSPSAYPPSAYPNGVCLRGTVNLSGTNPLTFESLDNGTPSHGITERVLTFEQTAEDLGDESWENKYEIAKGHRGFLDGEFLMVMYAWSPNWLATSHGHEPYNLFIRRSFDGGLTWTTTPESLGGSGTVYDQVFGVGYRSWTVTRNLEAGEFEPARNVSQITTSKETVLDPRYSPTNVGTQSPVNRLLQSDGTFTSFSLYDDDALRDPSRFFAVFETGDATTIGDGGEADPLDLFASRGTVYGDFLDSEDKYAHGRGEWEERWDWLENKAEDLSGEPSIAASPGGDFMWAVWNQWQETDDGVKESDPVFRRLWWDDSVTLVADAGTYEAVDGQNVELAASVSYDGKDDLYYVWDLDSDGVFETAGQGVNLLATGAMQGVAVRVCDAAGYCDIDQGWVNPAVHNPRVWRVRAEQNPALAGETIDLAARFTDPGTGDSHDAVIDWGDGAVEAASTTESTDGKGAALVVGSHAYAAPGLYTVKVTVTDDDGHSGWDYLRYVAIYDNTDGTVDALVTFDDPQGAGEADLEFNARYWHPTVSEEDSNTAIGMVKFRLGDIAFESKSYDYLVITPENEVFLKGRGALNGVADYRFLVAAVDGKPDLVRIKIWKGNGLNEHLVYDSQPGEPEDAVAVTEVDKGKVTIERK